MIQKYARLVIHEGLQRQVEFNRLFMEGLHKCIEALDSTPSFEAFNKEVNRIIVKLGTIDPLCASSLREYVDSLISEADKQQADYDTWTA